ncbi:MAG TPA: hypothetical protein VJR87_13310 [Allosphingosinicella sp.]|nr:hypothetical protein [Allosphingosinicella sp.]
MSSAPPVKPGDWIKVGSIDCVVSHVRGVEPMVGDLEVVCNPDQPAAYQVNWEDGAWVFAHPMHGIVAERVPRLEQYVAILRKGRSAR